MKVEIKPSVLIQSGTLYRIEDLLNYMYSEALKGVNEQEFVSPTHEALRQKTYDSGFLNPYGKQYLIETQDGYDLNTNLDLNFIFGIKLGKKHKEHIHDCINNIIVEKNKFPDEKKLATMFNIILICIMDCLTPRELEEETLTQQTGTRHALITEVLSQLEKIYIYNKKSMNKEQKKSYALLILTSLEKLVEQNYIKQDIITIGGEMFTDRGGGLTHVVEFATIPYIDKKPQEKIRTIYIYSTLKTLRLPLNMGYWNISLIPLSQKIQGDNIIYHQGVTLKSIQRVTLENKHSAKHIILENITIINRLKELKLYINSNLYEIVKTKILKNPHFTAKDILQDIKNSIQQMKIPVYQPKTKKDSLAADIDKRVGVPNKHATRKKIKSLQKNINKQLIILDFLMLEKFKNLFAEPIYFYFMFDFRGRLYYKSRISPQNSYLFRYIYDYGRKDIENKDLGLALPIAYEKGYNIVKQSLGLTIQLKEPEKRILVWLIIEFAKLQKTENIELYGGAFSIENLIQLGIQVLYREKHENLDTEKEVQYNYTKYIWDMLLQKKTLDRYYIIYKDATASAIQLLTTYLGPINTEIAIHANLMSETHGYDTYYYIIQIFKKNHTLNIESIAYFNRNNLKKTIMTYNYSATFYTCWQEFEDRLKEGNPLLNNTQLQLIKQDYKAFYKFLDDLFNKQNIFTNSLDGLTQDLLGSYEENKQITIQSTDKATIHLHYLISVSRRGSLQNKKIRKTLQMTELKDKLDLKKTRQALKPNATHAMDASLIRETIVDLRKPLITIHDCYGIDIYMIDATIYSINKNINRITRITKEKTQNQGFSNFIVL